MTTAGSVATIADFYRVAERVRNWGRWGTDDQLGTPAEQSLAEPAEE